MGNTEAITFLFHKQTISLLDHLQQRFDLKSREAVIAEAVKLLAVGDRNHLYVFRDGVLAELEIGNRTEGQDG